MRILKEIEGLKCLPSMSQGVGIQQEACREPPIVTSETWSRRVPLDGSACARMGPNAVSSSGLGVQNVEQQK